MSSFIIEFAADFQLLIALAASNVSGASAHWRSLVQFSQSRQFVLHSGGQPRVVKHYFMTVFSTESQKVPEECSLSLDERESV